MRAGITVVKDPLLSQVSRIHVVDLPITIGDWIRENNIDPTGLICCRGLDDYVLKKDWDTEFIRNGDAIALVPIPLQGRGGGNSALQSVLTLLLVVVSLGVGLAAAGAMFAAGSVPYLIAQGVTSAAIMMAGSFALNAIFAPDTPNKESNTYQLSNQQNIARIGAPIPVLYGRFRFYPDLIAQPYTETLNEETWIYLFMCLTQGHCEIHEIRLEDTPISNFHHDSYQYEVYPPGYTGSFMFPVSVIPSQAISNIELIGTERRWREISQTIDENPTSNIPTFIEPWSGPYVITDRGIGFSEIALDFSFPKGLVEVDQGVMLSRGCGISAQLREIGYDDDEPVTRSCFIDGTFYDNGSAFTGGPVVTFANRSYFYVYFDHHPGFLTKRVEADDVEGDYDKARYARTKGNWQWVDNARPETGGPFEYTQTICLTGWEYDANGLVGGSIPFEKLEGTDLQVIDMEQVPIGSANPIPGISDSTKTYYRASVLLPSYEGVLNYWEIGRTYSEGDYAGNALVETGATGTEVQGCRCKKAHVSSAVNAPPPFGTTLKTGVEGSPSFYSVGVTYHPGDYVVQGTTIYQYRYATSGTAPTPGSGSGWATYWSSDLYWRPIYGTDAVNDQMKVSSRFVSTYFWHGSSGDSSPEGLGGKSLKYSKWYNIGEALMTDWYIAHDQVGGIPSAAVLEVSGAMGGGGLFESYNIPGSIPRTKGLNAAASGAVVKLADDYVINTSNSPVAIPPATIVFRAKKQAPFNKTVKELVSNICDELTTLDDYGNKRDEAPWSVSTTYSLGDKASYNQKNYEYIHATPAAGYYPTDASRWKFSSYILQRSEKKFGRFEARFRQTGRERFESDTRYNSVVLNSAKLYLPERRTYGDVTTMCLKLKAGYTINQNTKNKINVEATRKLPIYRGTGSISVADNAIRTVNRYGSGCVEVTFEEDVTYSPGDLVDFGGVVESGVSAIKIAGIPAAMLSGKKLVVAKTGKRSYLFMLDKVVRIRSTRNPLSLGVAAVGAPAWNSSTAYSVGDMVQRLSVNYRCIQNNTNVTPPNASYWTVLSGTVLTLSSSELAIGNDGPDNLVGLGVRISRNGVYDQRIYGTDVFSLAVENNSPYVSVKWPSHGFSFGDDFSFSNVPSSVPTITGVSSLIWKKLRNEAGITVGNEKHQGLTRSAHVITKVIDSDNFQFTLTGSSAYVNDGENIQKPVTINNATPEAVSRIEYETSGGLHYAKITTIPAWAASTLYVLSSLVRRNGTLYRCITQHTSQSTFDTSKWSTEGTSKWDTSNHTPSSKYVGGKIYLTPPDFAGMTELAYNVGEWCTHVYSGDATRTRRYYRRIGTGIVSVGSNGSYNSLEEPGYPGSTKWQEHNRSTSGEPSWYFDIVGFDGSRYRISSPGNPAFTEVYGSATTQKLGTKCIIRPNYSVQLGNTSGERLTISKPVEYKITANTANVIAIAETGTGITSGSTIEVVLCGYGVSDSITPTQQTSVYANIGGPPGWSDTAGRTWSAESSYVAGDRVKLSGKVYLCVLANSNVKPSNTTYWKEDSEQFFPTRSIAWAFCDALRSTTYGAGIPSTNIDIDELVALDELWMGRGAYTGTDRDPSLPEQWLTDHAYELYDRVMDGAAERLYICLQDHTSSSLDRPGTSGSYGYWEPTSAGVPDTVNGVLDKQTTLWSALSAILGVGRAAPTIKYGSVVGAVRDDYKPVPKQLFGDRNIMPGTLSIKYQGTTDDENDSLSIKFVNEKTWTDDSVLAFPADPTDPRYYCRGYLRGNTLYAVPATWSSGSTYRKNEYVTYSNATWISLQDSNTAHVPSAGSYWAEANEIFVPDNTMDSILWDDGQDVSIISYIDSSEVVVSVFGQKGTPGDPQGFTLLRGTHRNPATIEGWGFTSRKQAWREAKFRVDSTRNRRATITFSTEKEGLIASYGDRVLVGGLWGQSGDIVYAEQLGDGYTYIHIDRDLSFKDDGIIPFNLHNKPVFLFKGSREVRLLSQKEHRLSIGSVVVISGITGSEYTFVNGTHTVYQTPDEYTFVILKNTVHTGPDQNDGGGAGVFYLNYQSSSLQAVFRKKNGGVVGPMSIEFWKDPTDFDYFTNLRVLTADLDGFVPVFDTDMEKTHYLVGMSNSFRRDCKVVEVSPRENQVDITVFDDGDNSHYQSDHTYRYVSDIPVVPTRQDRIAPYFENSFDDAGVPISAISAAVGGTAAAPLLTISWKAAKGASLYIVEYTDLDTSRAWSELARTAALSCVVDAPVGTTMTIRVTPVGYGYGQPAYFSGAVRLDGNYRSLISFPGSIVRTGANIDIEPLDDLDATTIAAGSIRKQRQISGTKNGYNKKFELPSRAIKNNEMSVEFGTPQSTLKYVETRSITYPPLNSYAAGDQTYTKIRMYRGNGIGWAGVGVGDRIKIRQAQGVYLTNLSTLDGGSYGYNPSTTYSIGKYAKASSVYWRCIANGTVGVTPGTDIKKWVPLLVNSLVISGQNLELEAPLWKLGTTYALGKIVRDANGNKHKAIQASHVASTLNSPPNSSFWTPEPDGYEVKSVYGTPNPLYPLSWIDSWSYAIGDQVSYTDEYRRYFECVRPHTSSSSNKPILGSDFGIYWSEIQASDLDSSEYGASEIEIDIGSAEFQSGYSITSGCGLAFDGTPAIGEPATVLPTKPFMTAPFQDRIYVFDPGHGIADGFTDSIAVFAYDEAEATAKFGAGVPFGICGIDSEFIAIPSYQLENNNASVVGSYHNIYVINSDWYYFIPRKPDGTRLLDSEVPTSAIAGGSIKFTRYFMPRILITRKLSAGEFAVYGTELTLGIAPNQSDELTVTYASRTQ